MKISFSKLKQLHEETHCSILLCKKVLEDNKNDFVSAKLQLTKQLIKANADKSNANINEFKGNVAIYGNSSGLIESHFQRTYTPSGKVSTRLAGYVKHTGLNIEKKFTESDPRILEMKLSEQASKWTNEWNALEKNLKVQKNINQIKNILRNINSIDLVDWDTFLDETVYAIEIPTFSIPEPVLSLTNPIPSFFDKLLQIQYLSILEEQKVNYENLWIKWLIQKKQYEVEKGEWQRQKLLFEHKQEEYNRKVNSYKSRKDISDKIYLEWFYIQLLQNSKYPIKYDKSIAIEFNESENILIVEYYLPNIDSVENIKEVKYNKSTNTTSTIPFSKKELESIYEDLIYKLTLRLINQIIINDTKNAIKGIVFNGWVNSLNKGLGKYQNLCILSVFVTKTSFSDINLENVDAKACFKQLKGISASQLSTLVAIPPILRINKEDKRFIQERNVTSNLDSDVNIASMDWQDFEHLIRELFEKEYSRVGGEVKVTQSSRDKGVDVIAFDPDPIRGGKIIIQAKRYTNTVLIESVRALYGIMQDEGAMKGILITTSDYGSDSYEFAKNKPISLLNGSNLLSMLHKHNYKGKIDLSEAKT